VNILDLDGKVLTVRADASSKMGTGHVMRCLAIAQAWYDSGGNVVFISYQLPKKLKGRLIEENFRLIEIMHDTGSDLDAEETARIVKDYNTSWLIVDGYHFFSNYQKIIKQNKVKLLFIDDFGHCDYYYADIVLNRSLRAHEIDYSNKEHHTKLLLGADKIIFRREFKTWKSRVNIIPEITRNIMITFGGSDHFNSAIKVLKVLEVFSDYQLEIKVILGSDNNINETLRNILNSSNHSIELLTNVNDMASIMAWSDIAITAGGSTIFESAFMGLPSISIKTADNQKSLKILDELGVTKYSGDEPNMDLEKLRDTLGILLSNQSLRITMSNKGKRLFERDFNLEDMFNLNSN